ncbi:B12-binding domain-containing radical SAM protein [bacterium]|nr:B12-binding domain-containing radical SAM protein [bacterium]
MNKLLMIIFTENSNLGVSMLCSLTCKYGWEADIYFVPPNGNKSSDLAFYIEKYRPNLIGFSFKSWERSQALSLAEDIQSIVPAKIIAGGIHPSLMPKDIALTGLFDAVVAGDGMGIWKEILDKYMGFSGEIISGKSHPNKELYTEYFYSKSQIERMKATETATVLTALGCPYNCRFCHSGKQKFISHPVENIVQCVLKLYNNYGVRNFHFLDDLFACNLNRLKKFRKIMEESNSKAAFSSQVSAKADCFTANIAQELIRMGVETVNFGIETASPKLLEFLNKRQTVDDACRAVEVCHENGLNCVINLMFGIPTQDEEDYRCTLEFVKKAKPDSVNSFFYTPYPGTELYDYCFEHQYLPEAFNKHRFDWFRPDIDGISDLQLKLNKVDYDLAINYIEQIDKVMNRDETLFERMEIVDLQPWVLIGTTRHYYYKTLMRKLASLNWGNCLGYIDIDTEAGFNLESKDDLLIRYNEKTSAPPFWCVTYSFLGSDFDVIERQVKNRFGGDSPLISISSFQKSHTKADIHRILKDQI